MKTYLLICLELMFGCKVIYLNLLLLLRFTLMSSAVNVTIGFLVPKYGALSFGPEIDLDIINAINRCNNDGNLTALRSAGIEFGYKIADTRCDTGTGLYEMVQLIQSSTKNPIQALIGPACDDVCSAAGLLTGKWNIPMISYSCASTKLTNTDLYPTFTMTSSLYSNVAHIVADIMNRFHWKRIIMAEGPEAIWRETAVHIQNELETLKFTAEIQSLHAEEKWLGDHIEEQWKNAQVILICAYSVDIYRLLCEVKHHEMLNDYVYITLDFGMSLNFAEYTSICKDDTFKVFEGILDITVDVFGTQYQTFALNETAHSSLMTPMHTYKLLDAIYLLALAMNQSFADHADGSNSTDGRMLASLMVNKTFQGFNGMVDIDHHGTRKANFSVFNVQNGQYVKVASSNGSLQAIYFHDNITIVWPNGDIKIPLGYPECGWYGELCAGNYNHILIPAGISGSLLIIIIAILSVYCYKKKKRQEQLENMNWIIPYSELCFNISNQRARSNFSSILSSSYDLAAKRPCSRESEMSGIHQVFIKTAQYQSTLVAVKAIQKNYLAVSPNVIHEVNHVRGLKHININQFLGACIEPLNICLVSVYCNKGSLQDVLENENIRLDWIFKLSFASDISKGMTYIHDSVVHSHGRLKSSNVYVDNFWTCKIGDLAMPFFREGERLVEGKHAQFSQLLWTAPEILRDPELYPNGSQKGDVYSFAIILQEIVLRSLPFGDICTDPQAIIERVRVREHPTFRPQVPADCADEAIIDLMRICWEEIPPFRPNFVTISDTLRKCNNGKKSNLVEQMISLMQKYSDNLEDLVCERTKQLEEEQKKTEDLLCRMLPRKVAEDLKRGKDIVPLTYECVTIYFSDIVGFTSLCSDSTPMEVVNFLNDLYTCFDTVLESYDVYKVETIGDAYMVVSGLPVPNGNQHAGEIATMALDLLSCVVTFKIRHRPNKQLQLRIGVHSGPVAAGVVGVKMPRYCLFGDTVNFASRMESSGLALRIHVSPHCYKILEASGGYHVTHRGTVFLKGKGAVETYFLTGKDGFDKDLPDITKAATLEEHEFK